MDTASTFGFEDLFAFALTDMAKAVSERNSESEAQQFARCQAAVHMIMGFSPRDVIEVMLAGHCVMMHEVMTAEVHDSLCGEAPSTQQPALRSRAEQGVQRQSRPAGTLSATPRRGLPRCNRRRLRSQTFRPRRSNRQPDRYKRCHK